MNTPENDFNEREQEQGMRAPWRAVLFESITGQNHDDAGDWLTSNDGLTVCDHAGIDRDFALRRLRENRLIKRMSNGRRVGKKFTGNKPHASQIAAE